MSSQRFYGGTAHWIARVAVSAVAAAGIVGATAPTAEASTVYTVKAGDTLARIATTYHTTVTALASSNDIVNVNQISVGQKLTICGTIKASGHAAVSECAPGTPMSFTISQQVMVAQHTSGTKGTWARYQWEGAAKGWVKLSKSSAAVFGSGGVVVASQRVQNTNETPAGVFPIVYAFGRSNPGAHLPYRTIDACSWFVEDPTQPDYNRWREDCAAPATLGEHLADYQNLMYRQAAVIGFNYSHPVRYGAGSGAGIFLHYALHYTGGCVGLPDLTELTNTIRWMNSAQHPQIVIKR